MKLETIYKKTKTGATQEWTIEVVGNKYRTHSGQVGGVITTNEWTIVYGKNTGKLNETTSIVHSCVAPVFVFLYIVSNFILICFNWFSMCYY